jgi:fibronectin-binding autotransporter adhesin
MNRRLAQLKCSSSVVALHVAFFSALTLNARDAFAICTATGNSTVCSGDTRQTVGGGPQDSNRTVTVVDGALVSVGDRNAIALGDNANITLQTGSVVTNDTLTKGNSSYQAGPNTIEFGNNGSLTIEQGARLVQNGTSVNSEPVNVIGSGNVITNRGEIISNNNAAIWFEDRQSGARNRVDNYGSIRRVGGGNVIGSSGGSGIDFINRTGGVVEGNLVFGGGNDNLTFEAGSRVTGDVNGGSGTNRLFLQGEAGSEDTLPGALRNFVSLDKTGAGKWTVSGPLEGFRTVTVQEGTLALTGNNVNYDGNVIVRQNGILESTAVSLPESANPVRNRNNVQNDGLVRFLQTSNGTYVGQIIGSGRVEKNGNGILELKPNGGAGNTYAGGTTINAGTIAVNEDRALGAQSGGLGFNGGTLRFDSSFDLANTRAITTNGAGATFDTNGATTTIQQNITGSSSVTKTGAGSLSLEGANSFEGDSFVRSGTLFVNGDQSAARGTTFVEANAMIGGKGTIGGNLIVADGARLAPGPITNEQSELTINGDLVLSGGSSLDYNFGQANVVGGPLNDLTTVKGDLSLDGTLNVTVAPGGAFDPGIYRVISYDGTLTNNTLEIGSIPSQDFFVQTSVGQQVNLVNVGNAALNFWDATDPSSGSRGNGQVNGGTGIWQAQAAGDRNINWTDDRGSLNAPFRDDAFAIFAATDGTVTIDNSLGDVRASGMQFASDGYIIAGDSLTLSGAGQSIVRVGDGSTTGADFVASIQSVVTGDTTLQKTDAGVLRLLADNTYTGGTSIQGGTVEVTRDANLGAGGTNITMNNGALRNAATMETSRRTELQEMGGTFLTNEATTLTHSGDIFGSGPLNKIGTGTLIIGGNNVYTGQTSINEGTLQAGGVNIFSDTSAFKIGEAGTLALNDFDQNLASLANAGTVKFGRDLGNVLTVSGDYIGEGGRIEFNTVLAGDDAQTDRLIVNGRTSGQTNISVRNIGGEGAQTEEGIKLIEVAGQSDGVFDLEGQFNFEGRPAVVGGAYAYQLFKNGVATPADGDWYLRSKALKSGPLYQPGVPSYEAYAQVLQALSSVPTLEQRVGKRAMKPIGSETGSLLPPDTDVEGLWGRMEASSSSIELENSTANTGYDLQSFKFEAGADGIIADTNDGTLIGGVFIHYTGGTTKTKLLGDADFDYARGSIDTNGFGVGGTLTWYADNGFYVDAQAKSTWFNSDLSLRSGEVLASNNNGVVLGTSIEIGKVITIDPNWSLTPQAQLSYLWVDHDTFTDPYGARISLKDGGSVEGRVGLSAAYRDTWTDEAGLEQSHHFYGIVNIYREFSDGTQVDVDGVSLTSQGEKTNIGLGVGGSYNWDNSRYSIYGEASVKTGLSNFGDSYSLKGIAGFRIKF